jgi:hypothetical protein
VLEKLYGAQIVEQIEQSLVAETLAPALEQAGLEPVAEPAIAAKTPAPDAEFVYTARIESAGLRTARPAGRRAGAVTLAGASAQLGASPAQRRCWRSRRAAAAPRHVLDRFRRTHRRAALRGRQRAGVELELGSQRFLPGFEEQLAGPGRRDRESACAFPTITGRASWRARRRLRRHVAAIRRRMVPADDSSPRISAISIRSRPARARSRGSEAAAEGGAKRSCTARCSTR